MKPIFFIVIICLLEGGHSSAEDNAVITSFDNADTFNQTDIPDPTAEPSTEVHEAVRKGVNFLLTKRNPSSFGWEQETHRALTVLALAGALPPQDQQSTEQKLTVKELELRLALALAKHHQEEFTAGQLALYVNALLGLCHNPRDFYGLNLVSKLRNQDENLFSYSYGLQSLALCNAGVHFEKARILKLIEYIKEDESEHGGITDSLSMVTLALACGLKYQSMPPIDRYLNRAVNKLKQSQKTDGSFGNIYTSGLAVQALLLADSDGKNWNRSLAEKYLLSQQRDDGSFVDFMGTFFAVPPLLQKTFASFANWSCDQTEPTQQSNSEETTTQIAQNNRSAIAIGLRIRAPEIQVYQVELKGYQADNLYNILVQNSESVSIEFKSSSFGHMIVGVDGLNQDPARNKYWLIYIVDKEGKETSATTGVDGIFPEDGDSFVFELKTFA